MIDHSKLSRTRQVVQKCLAGASITRPSADTINKEYAKKNGFTFENGKFYDQSGKEVNVPVEQLDSFGDQLEAQNGKQAAVMQGISSAINIGQSFLASTPNVQNQSPETQMMNAGYDTAANVVSQVHPLAGTIMKMGGFAADALTAAGIGTDQISGMDKFMDSKFMKATPFGLINAIGAKKTDSFSVDQEVVEQAGASYGGTLTELQKAAEIAGKKVGTFTGTGGFNSKIAQARKKMNDLAKVTGEASDQRSMVDAMGDLASRTYQFQTEGGFDPRYARASAKQGAKLNGEFVPQIIDIEPIIDKIVPQANDDSSLFGQKISPSEGKIVDWVPEIVEVSAMKSGGKVEKQLDAPEIEPSSQKNLIPEGAMHKNCHHMENADNMTKKGIPVVDTEHVQQAEIECNEIIFTKEVTKKLEELYKEFYAEDTTAKRKDELAVEAGKLLTKEIMLNTDDRTGLIDTLKQGGSITSTTPA